MVTQVLTVDLDLLSINNSSYRLLDLWGDTSLAKDLFPKGYYANYLDASQNEWFIKEYLKQLDAIKDRLVPYFKRLFEKNDRCDLVLGGYECGDLICHRHILKRWLAENITGVWPGGELNGDVVYFDAPVQCVIDTSLDPSVYTYVVGCHIIVYKSDQAAEALRQMRLYDAGPIINASGVDLKLGIDTYRADTEDALRSHLWAPRMYYLAVKEKNDVDKLYAKARSAV